MKLRFIGKNGGKDALTEEQMQIMREFTYWVMHKFLSKRLLKNVTVLIRLNGTLLEDAKAHGESLWEDENNIRPRSFSVDVDTANKFQNIMHTLAHELVHVKQWASGEWYQLMRRDDLYMFMGREYDAKNIDYWDLPWEIEAHGRSLGLVRQFVKATNRQKEPWAKAKMSY